MRVIANRIFCRRSPHPAPILRRPLACVSRTPRHVAWTRALVERLMRRVLSRAVPREDLVLARAARHWTWCSQSLLLRAEPGRSVAPILMRERSVIPFRESARRWNGGPVAGSEARNGGSFVPFPFPRQLRRNPGPESAVVGGPAPRSYAFGVLETAPRHQRWQWAYARQWRPLQRVLLDNSFGSPRREAFGLRDAESLPYRVARQHRRVEEGSFARALNGPAKRTPSPLSELPSVMENPQPRVGRRAVPGSPTERRDPASQPDMNVTQIADAVLKQLDRRLVAARERMGRI
jgi:hypothetical protein